MMKEICAQCLQPHVDPQTGQEVDEATAQAKYTDGVLELTLPKKAAAAARKLAVH